MRRPVRVAVAAALVVTAVGLAIRQLPKVFRPIGVDTAPVAVEVSPGETRFLKGQTHVHSSRSGDSGTAPEAVVRWYEEHGFDFIVFTDHNFVTRAAATKKLLALPGVEITQNLSSCEPPPPTGLACLLHVNALLVDPAKVGLHLPLLRSSERLDLFGSAIELARDMDGLVQINHPNFHYAADANLLTTLARKGAGFVEVANEAVDSNNEGDASHPSSEALWDAVLTQGGRLWGVASDDAHHYDDAPEVVARGDIAHTGNRGFVMVRARLDAASIRAALVRGDFYSSTGVLLSHVETSPQRIELEVSPELPGEHQFRLIGEGGRALMTQSGRTARFDLREIESRYVRAEVIDATGRKALIQPVWLR